MLENKFLSILQTPIKNHKQIVLPLNNNQATETNIHVNQLYYHVQDISKQQQQPDLTRNIYVPHQKADRVVSITNKNIVESKNLQKLQLQLQQQQLKEKKKQTNKNSSNEQSSTQSTASIQQITAPMLNQSFSSENDSQDLRLPTRVSAKIQQLLDTLKVFHYIYSINKKFRINLKHRGLNDDP